MVEDYLKSKLKTRYYCLGCFQYTKKKYFLQVLKDETGKAYKYPNCKFISGDKAMEGYFKKRELMMRICKKNLFYFRNNSIESVYH